MALLEYIIIAGGIFIGRVRWFGLIQAPGEMFLYKMENVFFKKKVFVQDWGLLAG